ncbi:hypothetical protein Acsp03_23100 [Actinomadura sp. NBRC 104412]|nr:hypothetical protein Acsp03_23100 [Actinomadura sp. NBRC 104412]
MRVQRVVLGADRWISRTSHHQGAPGRQRHRLVSVIGGRFGQGERGAAAALVGAAHVRPVPAGV